VGQEHPAQLVNQCLSEQKLFLKQLHHGLGWVKYASIWKIWREDRLDFLGGSNPCHCVRWECIRIELVLGVQRHWWERVTFSLFWWCFNVKDGLGICQ